MNILSPFIVFPLRSMYSRFTETVGDKSVIKTFKKLGLVSGRLKRGWEPVVWQLIEQMHKTHREYLLCTYEFFYHFCFCSSVHFRNWLLAIKFILNLQIIKNILFDRATMYSFISNLKNGLFVLSSILKLVQNKLTL